MSLYKVSVKLQVDKNITFGAREYYISINDWGDENFDEAESKDNAVKAKAVEHYRTFADNIDEALKIAKSYAAKLAKDPDETHEEREVTNVWVEDNIDLVSEESVKA